MSVGSVMRSARHNQAIDNAQNAQQAAKVRADQAQQQQQAQQARQEAEKSNKPTNVTPATSVGSHVNTWAWKNPLRAGDFYFDRKIVLFIINGNNW